MQESGLNQNWARSCQSAGVVFAGRSLAAQDHGDRGVFHRGHSVESGAALRLPHHSGKVPDSLAGHARHWRPPLVYELLGKLLRREFGSDLLGGISIVTSVLLGEYLAGSIVVLMLSGRRSAGELCIAERLLGACGAGQTDAVDRPPETGFRNRGCGAGTRSPWAIRSSIYPHDICPVDGIVIEGHGVMDESYLTGEPFKITKTSGSTVISGAINGESALTIRATKRAADSRYAKIMEVMRESESKRPQLRRLGDRLGAIYTPVAVARGIARLGDQWRSRSVPGGAGDRHALPSAHRHPGRHHRLDFPLRPPRRSSSRVPLCSSRSTSAGPRFSTRPGR